MMPLRDRARDWLVDHLHVLLWMLLALWAPPIVFTLLVDLGLAGGAGSGYPALRDPGLLLSIMQLVLMIAALPLIYQRKRSRAWQLLCGAAGVWCAHGAWTILGRLRLIGRSDLASRETLTTLVGLAATAAVLFELRSRFTRPAPRGYVPADHRSATRRPTARQEVRPGESIPEA